MFSVLPVACAEELQRFSSGSLEKIEHHFSGAPFVLSLWSVDCPPCYDDLKRLEHAQQETAFRLVLISTDALEQRERIAEVIAQYRFDEVSHWVFAEDFVEKLRYQIDANWSGELPRTYFYSSIGERIAVSGVVDESFLKAWLKNNASP